MSPNILKHKNGKKIIKKTTLTSQLLVLFSNFFERICVQTLFMRTVKYTKIYLLKYVLLSKFINTSLQSYFFVEPRPSEMHRHKNKFTRCVYREKSRALVCEESSAHSRWLQVMMNARGLLGLVAISETGDLFNMPCMNRSPFLQKKQTMQYFPPSL